MTRLLRLHPLTAAAFAPFGDLVEPPLPGNRRTMGGIGVTHAGTTPHLSFNHPRPHPLPLLATAMEMHPLSSQTFIPLDVSRWIVLVAPDAGGVPDPACLVGFLADGTQAVTYRPGTWHHPLRVLDRAGRFAVLMWSTGKKAEDETWSTLPQPVSLEE